MSASTHGIPASGYGAELLRLLPTELRNGGQASICIQLGGGGGLICFGQIFFVYTARVAFNATPCKRIASDTFLFYATGASNSHTRNSLASMKADCFLYN